MPLIIKGQDRMAGNVTNARTDQRPRCCTEEEEDVSAEDLSKQLENRHFIHQLLFPLGTIEWTVCVCVWGGCDSGNSMWHHLLQYMLWLVMWKSWQQQTQRGVSRFYQSHIFCPLCLMNNTYRGSKFCFSQTGVIKTIHKGLNTNDWNQPKIQWFPDEYNFCLKLISHYRIINYSLD